MCECGPQVVEAGNERAGTVGERAGAVGELREGNMRRSSEEGLEAIAVGTRPEWK